MGFQKLKFFFFFREYRKLTTMAYLQLTKPIIPHHTLYKSKKLPQQAKAEGTKC